MADILGLVTVKNEADIIKEMLDKNGRFMDFVVLDNGSSDGTLDIVKTHRKVLKWGIDTSPYNENVLVKKLFQMADEYPHQWFFEIDADEIIEDSFIDFRLPDLPVNCVTFKIHYCLPDGRIYKVYDYWQRLYRRKSLTEALEKADQTIAKLHQGKMPLTREERVFFHSHIPIKHYQVRSFEQGMRKYNQYNALDPLKEFQPKGYEHIKKLAEAIKNNDYSGVVIRMG